MVSSLRQFHILSSALAACGSLFFAVGTANAQNEVTGELQLSGASQVEKRSGVWIDGQYVGYLRELKGARKVSLLPGEHEIAVRQSGYKDFTQELTIEPGQKQVVHVTMAKDPQAQLPAVIAEVDLSVKPRRAAVFLDDRFVGHAREFGAGMRVSPGKHRIKVALPGYQTFETEINLLPNQKSQVKTELVKGSITQAGPLIRQQ
jgi:hypothetical protein